MTIAFGLHSYAYSYFRGLRRMNSANTLDMVNSAVAPLAAVTLAARFNVATAVLILATMILAWTSFQSRCLWSEVRTALCERYRPHLTKSLLLYSLPRIPGDLALAGLLSVPLILVTHMASIADAGRFALAQNLLMIVAVGLSPLSIVLLPYVSESLANGDISTIKANSVLLFQAVADISLYFALHMAILADIILTLWVGQRMVGATSLVRVLMIVSPFYAIYFVFRSVIDATTVKPVTSFNLVAAFVTLSLGYFLLLRYHLTVSFSAALAMAFAVVLLGSLTFFAMMRFYGARGFFDVATLRVFLVNCALAGSLLGARYVLGIQETACLTLEVLAALIFAVTLLLERRPWALALLRHFGFDESIKRTEAARELLVGWFRRPGTSAE
jgi:O-antigen/teichoic acid export membrane protein